MLDQMFDQYDIGGGGPLKEDGRRKHFEKLIF